MGKTNYREHLVSKASILSTVSLYFKSLNLLYIIFILFFLEITAGIKEWTIKYNIVFRIAMIYGKIYILFCVIFLYIYTNQFVSKG